MQPPEQSRCRCRKVEAAKYKRALQLARLAQGTRGHYDADLGYNHYNPTIYKSIE